MAPGVLITAMFSPQMHLQVIFNILLVLFTPDVQQPLNNRNQFSVYYFISGEEEPKVFLVRTIETLCKYNKYNMPTMARQTIQRSLEMESTSVTSEHLQKGGVTIIKCVTSSRMYVTNAWEHRLLMFKKCL